MEQNRLVPPSIIIAVGLVLTGFSGALSFYKARALENSLSVTGSAEQYVVSDTAKWTLQIMHSADLQSLAQGNAQMQHDLSIVQKYLEAKGIQNEWITVQPVSIETIYDYNRGGVPSGYNLRQTIIVEGESVDGIRTAAEASGEIIAKGAVVSTVALEYFVRSMADIKKEILAAAMEDAHDRAKKIAESAGGKLGNLRSASMGVLQVTARNSVDISDYGSYDTSVVEKKVTGVVRAAFGLR